MKKTLTILLAVLTASVFAVTPQKMSYQAVVRNSSNALVVNSNIGMQVSILQNSATGTSVYVERQFPTTNANGLVTIEIGSGTLMSGSFSTIDWSSGIYFIKTETDITGGANYTITGTSQLLSVPYALYALKAGNGFSGSYTDLSNKPYIPVAADGSETKVTAGTNITVTGTGTSASPYVINGAPNLSIGQNYQGGIIFWLDGTGQHGLISAKADIGGIQWYNGTNRYTGATGDGLYAGAMNTAMIVASQIADNQTGNFAAKACADYNITENEVTYGDWYLPSLYELKLLYLQNTVIVGFNNTASYWSSTEYNDGGAWFLNFSIGINTWGASKFGPLQVRAIRSF